MPFIHENLDATIEITKPYMDLYQGGNRSVLVPLTNVGREIALEKSGVNLSIESAKQSQLMHY